MKQRFIIFCTLMLLTQACKRDDHWPDPKRHCQIETHLVQKEDPTSPSNPPYPRPYQFTRTFGPDGLVNFVEFYYVPFSPHQQPVSGAVVHTGNLVYMFSEAGDTMLIGTLNRHGKPVSLTITEHFPFLSNKRFGFIYDNKHRLSDISVESLDGRAAPTEHLYQYDKFGNVTRIGSGSLSITFKYDYSRPIKGGYYEVGGTGNTIPWGALVMEMLGHLEVMQPHHMLIEANSTHYPGGTSFYVDQQVNADGYLVSYRTDLESGGTFLKCGLIWNCGNSSSTKY
jgi:hypothetical protein